MNIPEPTSLVLAVVAGTLFGLACIPHCFGMCGPLHLAMCLADGKRSFKSLSLFNAGRIVGYTLIGAICGLLGEQLSNVFDKPKTTQRSIEAPTNCCPPKPKTAELPKSCCLKKAKTVGVPKSCCPEKARSTDPRSCSTPASKFRNPRRYLMFLFPAVLMLAIGVRGLMKRAASSGEASEGFISRLFKRMQRSGPVACGTAASLLPCGVLYAAFAIAASTLSPLLGAMFLLAYCVSITFFLQLGIMVGTTVGRRFGPMMNRAFPWLALGACGVYVLLFVFN